MTKQHKVLISDPLADVGVAPLRDAPGLQVDIRTDLTPNTLLETIPAYHALLVRSGTQVTAAVIQAGKQLRVIARAGVGVDNIDVEAATQAGIIVVNAPTGNTVAAAEQTIALLMAVARRLPQADAHLRAGEWQRICFVGVEVRDKVLGLVGLGRVAQEVAQRAQGLNMSVLACDPYITAEFAAQHGVTLTDLDTLLAQADFVSLHVKLTSETRNMIGPDQLRQMKQGAYLINVARGGIVDENALAEVVETGHLAGAALDVFDNEPLAADSPLRHSDRIILTPHLGASTVEAQEQVAVDVALQVLDVLNDKPARYAVNAPIIPPKALELLIPYIDLAERLGNFLQQLGVLSEGQSIKKSADIGMGHKKGADIGIGNVELTAHGAVADHDLAYISAAAIKGLLTDAVEVSVNLVNAKLIAERRGLKFTERKQHQHNLRYEDILTLSATFGHSRWAVRGAILQDEPCIVAINDQWVDFPAQGHMLLTSHTDSPGIVGRIGMVLGQSDVNISFMHVGRHAPRTKAIMVLGIDDPITPEILEQINAIDTINWAITATL